MGMDFWRIALQRYTRIGVKRLLLVITLLMIFIYTIEERILSRYSENVEDTKLPYLQDDKVVGKIQRPKVTPVIIIGYMRSGSSLTGDILQQSSDVFYVYEPLHDLQKDYFTTMEEMFPEFQIRQRNPLYEFKSSAIQLFRAWFSCGVKYITSDRMRYHFNFFKYGNKTRKLVDCLEKNANETSMSSRYCTRILRQECLKSKVRILKTIRTRLLWVDEIMEEFKTLKIIYLVRDPRAVVNSLIKFGECDIHHGGVPGCSHFLCSNMEEDLAAYKFLRLLYPDRLEMFKFEQIASKPISVSKQLYKFIGLELDSAAEGYIRSITSAGRNSTGIMSTVRANSSFSIDAWRKSLNSENLFIVQSICKSVMEQLDYYHFIKP